jgi:hypothetical protein
MLPEFFSKHEIGIAEAQAAVEESYYLITSMGLIDRRATYEFHLEGVALGALTVSKAWYDAGIDVAMDDLQSCYYINFPETGGMQTEHRHRSVEIAPGCAAVYQPIGDVRMRTWTSPVPPGRTGPGSCGCWPPRHSPTAPRATPP